METGSLTQMFWYAWLLKIESEYSAFVFTQARILRQNILNFCRVVRKWAQAFIAWILHCGKQPNKHYIECALSHPRQRCPLPQPGLCVAPIAASPMVDYDETVWPFQSLFGFLFISCNLLVNRELAALNGDENVGVLCCWSHELCHNELSVLTCAHAQWLEALQTVLIVNLELLQSETSVLDKVAEECSVLNWFDDLFALREVLDGDT